jgi:pimeloyl-ACP methyl ester carboxylesterase
MPSVWPLLSMLVVAAAPRETLFVQVAPKPHELPDAERTPGRDRAVVLIHGLRLHPFDWEKVSQAVLHQWQRPNSLVVKQLSRESDVFAFAYAYNGALDDVSAVPLLGEGVRKLRLMGYRSVVLVGHSAGGIVARHFVEDNPDAGVTKVIQVCTPNGGSQWAIWQMVQPREADFLASLTKPVRRLAAAGRADRAIPAHVEFVCVVANGLLFGDGMVGTACQWPEDLQQQGIPAYAIPTTHWQTVRTRAGAELIAELVRSPQPRWDASRVAAFRRAILGDVANSMHKK